MDKIINGYNIKYRLTGPDNAARTAVMLQGWGTSLDLYDYVADSLNDEYRFIQFDLPGFGSSDEPSEPWDVRAYAEFFCCFMKEMGISKASLIGHSYGGRIIIKLAEMAASGSELPFDIDKIVLIDSAGIMPDRTPAQKRKVRRYKIMKSFLTSRPVHAMFPEVIDYWMSQQGSDDYRNASPLMKKCLVMAVNEDLREWLPHIRQETLLVWGDLDDATPVGDARIMEKLIPNAGLVILEGTGHYSYLEKPAEFRRVIRSFLTCGSDAAVCQRGGAE